GTVWAPIGPSPISEGTFNDNGLVSSIAVHPYNPNVIYIGTVGGGVWRTNDGGDHWTPLFDRQLALGVGEPGAIAIDPNNTDTVYVGTSGRFAPQPQAGLFKSSDGGRSWIQLGSGYPAGNTGNASQFVNRSIDVVIVDPANSNVLSLASSSGLFRSTDGGQNWTASGNGFGDARSLVMDASTPANARILYAGISARGAFRSNDGGQNWTQVLSASTPVVASAIGAGGFGKVVVALAPPTQPVANPGGVQVLYVSMQGTGGAPDPLGLFMSKNQGGTWVQQTATGMPTRTQGGYSFHMAVDPASPGDGSSDIIYFGAVGQKKSTDSGNTFGANFPIHSDTHSWAFIPQPSPTPSVVFCGNDGGIDKSVDGGGAWTSRNSGGLQTGLFYNIDIKPDATGSVTVGALQDNEIETTVGAAAPGWIGTNGGDGWDVAYDGVTPKRVYASSGFWSAATPIPCTLVFRSDDDGATFPFSPDPNTAITPWSTATDTGCYLAPVTTDPSTPGIVYASGSQNLWQSRDAGITWRILSPFNGTGNVDVAPANGNNVVIAVGNQVFVSTNALLPSVGPPTGVTFTNITRNLPSRNVARAIFDPIDPTIIYAVVGGFNGPGAGQSGHVFRTTVSATAWTDISPVLNIPFNAIAADGSETPTTIYVGTDFGVLRSVDGGLSWSVLDDIHFPRVPVLDLIYRSGILRAATYGRGAFDFTKPAGPAIAVHLEAGLSFGSVCKGPQFLDLEVYNVGSADLVINSVQRLMGSTDFVVLPTPGTPLVVGPGEDIVFTVAYNPTVAGVPELATIRISSNDPTAPVVDLSASGIKGTATLGTAIADQGFIGNACIGSFAEEELTINNSGDCPLTVFNISASPSDFIAPQLSASLLVDAGDSTEVTIRFQPTSFGAKSGTVTLSSNDPAGTRTVLVSGFAPAPRLALAIADRGSFGNCCVGSFKDEPLILSNTGRCILTVTSIVSSSGEFLMPEVLSLPLTIEADGDLELPIRFQPTRFGANSATITVTSDDPAGPHSIAVSGNAPSGKVTITGSAYFGGVKCCHLAFRKIAVCNTGDCDLHVTKVGFEHRSHHWRLVHNPFPATLHPGSCLEVVIRYKATQREPRPCELVIHSDDPARPVREVHVIAWTRCCCKKCCDDCRAGRCCEERHKECCEEHHRECCEAHKGDCREPHDEKSHDDDRGGEHHGGREREEEDEDYDE
ncbi:MAG: choice-of-anchor D domain-containing protein, partial [Terriglobia bacterium]